MELAIQLFHCYFTRH